MSHSNAVKCPLTDLWTKVHTVLNYYVLNLVEYNNDVDKFKGIVDPQILILIYSPACSLKMSRKLLSDDRIFTSPVGLFALNFCPANNIREKYLQHFGITNLQQILFYAAVSHVLCRLKSERKMQNEWLKKMRETEST